MRAIGTASLLLGLTATVQSQTLDATSLSTFCAGVVDYAYAMPPGADDTILNAAALDAVADPRLPFLPNACQVAIKTLVCASVYQPPTATPAVYKKPCKSLCDAVTEANDVCGTVDGSQNLLAVFGAAATFDCDATNDPTVCNDMSTQVVQIQESKESYAKATVKGSSCYGIIRPTDDAIWVPSGPLIDPSIAPMQRPGVMQAVLEQAVQTQLNMLPVFISSECEAATRTLACGVAMMTPQLQTNLAVQSYLGDSLYMPQFPHYNVCVNYNTKCAEFIALVNATQKMDVSQDCDGMSAALPNVKQFPKTSQILADLGDGLTLETDANTMSSANPTMTEPVCPEGFVIPEDPLHNNGVGLEWIPGSGCAAACPRPMFTDYEYNAFELFARIEQSIAFVLSVFMVITWSVFEDRRRQFFVRAFIYMSFGISATLTFAWIIPSARKPSDRFCANNAQPKAQSDGGYCVAQSLLIQYFAMGASAAWLLVAVNTYIKVHYHHWQIKKYNRWLAAFITLAPIIINTIPRASLGVVAYDGFSPYCWDEFGVSKGVTYGSLYGYVIIIVLTGCYCVLSIVNTAWQIRRRALTNQDEKFAQLLKIVKTPIIFTLAFMFIWTLMIATQINIDVNIDKFLAGFESWAMCKFLAFDGTDESTKACGAFPSVRPSVLNIWCVTIAVYGQAFAVFFIYGCRRDVYLQWKTAFNTRTFSVTRSDAGGHNRDNAMNKTIGANGARRGSGTGGDPQKSGSSKLAYASIHGKNTYSAAERAEAALDTNINNADMASSGRRSEHQNDSGRVTPVMAFDSNEDSPTARSPERQLSNTKSLV